jgi:predicted transcriptional regulator
MEREDLKSGSRSSKEEKAHSALCYIEVWELGLSCTFVAKELRISPSAVSKAAARGRGELDHGVIKGLHESL